MVDVSREPAPGTIRITDLGVPVLTELQQQAIAAAATVSIVLSETAVLDAARARTGLSDFGADDFRDRLRVWLQCVKDDDDLGPLGRLQLYEDFVRLASNRLRVEQLRRHPEILDIELRCPIVIAGLPRSGTTHLVNLIAADSRFRSMPLWEGMEPVPPANGGGEADLRIARARAQWGQFETLLPLMPAMHEMAPEHVHEDIELQQIDFSSYNLEWTCRAHAWRDWYLANDQTPHYLYALKVHRALSWIRGPERWLMKSPQHMENLSPLIRTYPDAVIVLTHRDPVAVIQSIVTMLAYGDRIRRAVMDLPSLAVYWIQRVEILLRACVRDCDVLPPARRLHVLFHEYMADTAATLRGVYDLAGLEITSETQARFAAYHAANPRGRKGQVAYDLQGDFGVDVAQLRERFQFYYERFPVEHERVRGETK